MPHLRVRSYALFFEVMTEKADHPLLDIVAATVPAGNTAFLIIDESQNLRECFLAGAAEELVVRHTDLPQF
jgi:hypothetical protein